MGVITSLALAGAGIIQANKARKAAKGAANAQEAAMNESTAESKRQYEEAKAMYDPVKKKLVAESMSDIPVAYTKQAAQIEKQFGEAQRGLLGRPYGSGILASTQQNLLLKEAEAKAGAYGSALDQQRAMRQDIARFDPSVQLGQQYAQASQRRAESLAQYYGQQRSNAEAAEGQAWGQFAQGASQLAESAYSYFNKPAIAGTTSLGNQLTTKGSMPFTYTPSTGSNALYDPSKFTLPSFGR